MGYEVDFLSVDNGERSGDAIAFRIGNLNGPREQQFVGVVDGGFTDSGEALVNHVTSVYNTNQVDLVVLTHPDDDHACGLLPVVEKLGVGTLWMHLPWDHAYDIAHMFKSGKVTDMSVQENIRKSLDSAMSLKDAATKRGIAIVEPFAGVSDPSKLVYVIGPSVAYYKSLLPDFRCTPAPKGELGVMKRMAEAVKKVAEDWNIETLDDVCDTSAENNSSAILAIKADDEWWMLTGDAGAPAINSALDNLDANFSLGNFKFVQIPHHGSQHNVGPTVLNRLLGPKNAATKIKRMAFVSASKDAPKHPSKKVTNAFLRRGAEPFPTNGQSICHSKNSPTRAGWVALQPLPLFADVED